MVELFSNQLSLGNEKLMIPDFNHMSGQHCETSSLMKILNYHGLFLSEEMLLGLGGGIGFIYWFTKKMPHPFVGVRNGRFPYFIKRICEKVDVELSISQTASAKRGYEELKAVLRATEPAVVYGDIGFLPYFGSPDAHFGGHAFVVFGLDEINDKVYISDRGKKPVIISISDLQKARASKFSSFVLKHALLKLRNFPSEIKDLETKSIEAILECCEIMLRPPIRNMGLAGMQKWANIIVKNWPVQFKGEDLFDCLVGTYIDIETGGTGGRAFRTMYTKFLGETSFLTNNPNLSDIAEMFYKSSKLWGEISAGLFPDFSPTLRRTRELLIEKDALFMEQNKDSPEKMKKINEELGILKKKAKEDLNKSSVFLSDVSQNILRCFELEKRAFQALEALLKS